MAVCTELETSAKRKTREGASRKMPRSPRLPHLPHEAPVNMQAQAPISTGNHLISSAIWNKQARVNFFKG